VTISLLLTAITFGWALVADLLQRENRAIDLLLVSSSQLVQPAASTSQRVKVLVDGESVDEIWVGTFRFENTGNIALERDDFDRDTRFFLPAGQIIEATITSDTSSSLRPKLTLRGPSSFEISRELMNPG
jgi:hypothetical protein